MTSRSPRYCDEEEEQRSGSPGDFPLVDSGGPEERRGEWNGPMS